MSYPFQRRAQSLAPAWNLVSNSTLMENLIREIKEDCRGRHWPLRLAMVGWFLYMLVHHLQSREYQSFLGGLNLVIHDWNYLLHKLGCLHLDTMLASMIRVSGLVAMAMGILWGAWVIKHILAAGPRNMGEDWHVAGLDE